MKLSETKKLWYQKERGNKRKYLALIPAYCVIVMAGEEKARAILYKKEVNT